MADEQPEVEGLEPFVARALEMILQDAALRLVNVNLPQSPRGMCWTRQSVRHYDGWVVPGSDPLGRRHYWFTVKPLDAADEGTDRWALEQGLVSLTPLRLDLTDESCLRRVKEAVSARVDV
jgi:5'-nucleotidase